MLSRNNRDPGTTVPENNCCRLFRRKHCSREPLFPGTPFPETTDPGNYYLVVPGNNLFPVPGARGPGTTVPGSNCSRELLLSARNRCRDRPPGTLFPGTTVPGNYYLVVVPEHAGNNCSRVPVVPGSRNPGPGTHCRDHGWDPLLGPTAGTAVTHGDC